MKFGIGTKTFEVDSVQAIAGLLVVNAFGTSITEDVSGWWSVFFEGDEVMFEEFEDAYGFAFDKRR